MIRIVSRGNCAVATCVAALLALAGPAAHSAESAAVDLDGWVEIATPHLTVTTDLEAQSVLGLLQVLEAQRALVLDPVGQALGGGPLPTTMLVFAEETSYAPFRLADREGQFLPTPFENFVVVHGGSPTRPLGMAAAHEYTHALMAELGHPMPLWLHEGLAEYFSTIRLFEERVVLGATVPGHRGALRNRAFLPFAELATVSGRSPLYHGDDGRRFYAQAWLTVHFLLSDDERARRLFDALAQTATDAGSRIDLEAVCGLSPAELDEALRRHLNRAVLPSRARSLTTLAPFEPRVRSLEPGELAYRLGLVALEQARWSELEERWALARNLLESAVARRPADGDAYAGLARLEAAQGQAELAQQLFERAVYLDALEPRSYAHYAELLAQPTADVGLGDREWAAARAAQMRRRALELEPGHPRLQPSLEGEGRPAGAGSGGPRKPLRLW